MMGGNAITFKGVDEATMEEGESGGEEEEEVEVKEGEEEEEG